MFKTMGSAPLTEIPLKGEYAKHDFERSARLFDIPYSQPETFPISTVAAARAMLYAQHHTPEKAVGLAKRLYRAYFAEGKNIGEQENVLALAAEEGIDKQKLANGIGQDDIKHTPKTIGGDAIRRETRRHANLERQNT